jgi:hypothetical protein
MFTSKKIRSFSLTAQSLITDLHNVNPRDETFNQLGILDGHSKVTDFLDHNERGLALEHVLYMVHESNIIFPGDELKALHSLAERLGVHTSYKVNDR